ncbi:MAG: hypothetical protein Alpg2KO_05730 [Alphaproteobacteria bacterium]
MIGGGSMLALQLAIVQAWDTSERDALQKDMYQRSAAMLQADQQAVTHVATTLMTDPEWQQIARDWDQMKTPEQVDALKKVHGMFMAQFEAHGITPNRIEAFEQAPFFCKSGLICSTRGQFQPVTMQRTTFSFASDEPESVTYYDDSRITWNTHEWADFLFGDSFEQAVNTMVHESTHGVQYQLSSNLKHDGQAGREGAYNQDAAAFQAGYDSYAQDHAKRVTYLYNPLEVQAFSNGDCLEHALRTADKVAKDQPDLLDPVRAIVSVCMQDHLPGETAHKDPSAEALQQADTEKDRPAGGPSV